jgi:hypothetical protein
MPCDSGCRLTIPALPGRVIYYSVITRDGTGTVIGRQRIVARAVE